MSMNSNSSASHVTITILDVSLSLVHIPRSRLTELTRPILKQLLRKSPRFLNLTANEIELSIFAEEDELDDFEPIARRDRQRQRLGQTAVDYETSAHRSKRTPQSCGAIQPVEISVEKWRVLQIDSHEDSLSNSGSRVRELSAPLAAAGISILYQSSYLSDFIFVKASRLAEVLQLLDAAGFSLYNTDPYSTGTSMPVGILDGLTDYSVIQLQEEANGYVVSQPGSPGASAVLSRTRSPSMASLTALSHAMSRTGTHGDIAAPTVGMVHRQRMVDSLSNTSPVTRYKKKTLSPTAAPVKVLTPDIVCVGLNESAADVWSTKILTLVGYPELIPVPVLAPSSSSPVPLNRDMKRCESLTNSLYEDLAHTHCANPELGQISPITDSAPEESIPSKKFRLSDFRTDHYPDDESSRDSVSPVSLSSCSTSDNDEEYFSSPSPYDRVRDSSTPSLLSGATRSSARSLPEQFTSHRKSKRLTLARLLTSVALNDTPRTSSASPSPTEHVASTRTRVEDKGKTGHVASPRVSFFSFTRTAEGSSLTTELSVLAALFSCDERHMIICSESLLDAGDALNERVADAERSAAHRKSYVFNLEHEDDLLVVEEAEQDVPGMMKCLQLDLQKFGLDKHGLVNRFSRVLEDNGINHMYSSTYKTANLLVDKVNAVRAQSLLRSC
ncbi:hypothetical protein M0805_005384 [Coniferiporia weirii]|nr:hypothetical protein M0805_005384 [Coniferiporia weirii]